MEIVDIIDIDNNVIGQTSKADVHEQGLRHRVSAVLLKNNEGKYLFPTASDIKVEAGKLYHSAAGHVSSGESYKISAIRELEEECGVAVEDVTYLGTYWVEIDFPTRKEKERFEVFEAIYDESMGPIVLNEEQVQEQWLSIDDVQKIYTTDPEKIAGALAKTCELLFT